MPLIRRIPKRGFTNIFAKKYAVIDLDDLNAFEDGAEVTPQTLIENGTIRKAVDGVKVLGSGSLEKKLTVKASKFSKSAQEKITALGGTAEVLQ